VATKVLRETWLIYRNVRSTLRDKVSVKIRCQCFVIFKSSVQLKRPFLLKMLKDCNFDKAIRSVDGSTFINLFNSFF